MKVATRTHHHARPGRRARATEGPPLLTARGAVIAGGAVLPVRRNSEGAARGRGPQDSRPRGGRSGARHGRAAGADRQRARSRRLAAGLAVASDVLPGHGSLGGILTAVETVGAALCVAWDMPFVPADLLTALAALLAGADAAVPESDSRRGLEPLCAAYGPACGPADPRRHRPGRRPGHRLPPGRARRPAAPRRRVAVRRPGRSILQRQ